MLAANWEKHDASTNTPKNYFADRQKTEKILKNIEKTIKNSVFTVRHAQTVKNLKPTKKNLTGEVFGLSINI